ncbi:MAG: hypothetical protein E5W82_10315 [Mesorhizobium sp.]|nr:MAG: hypothetical protein E5W82_10315 [Mesorhizobium sp.]
MEIAYFVIDDMQNARHFERADFSKFLRFPDGLALPRHCSEKKNPGGMIRPGREAQKCQLGL